ncbi:MAG TPA: glycine zipper domain-containing protein [Burkholderiales bacterium]|jgi:hypothetical protein|nr:glycine zipper domain-containing protein [Burkholderiales bacterium]
MKRQLLVSAVLGLGLSASVLAGEIDKGAVVGGAIGGGAGAAVGSAIGGRDGAIIGGAIGGATGAAIGSSTTDKSAKTQTVVVKETVVVREPAGGPPGHARGKKKGWKKHD